MELIPGGNDIKVNAQNVHDYVRRYAEFRMIKVLERLSRYGVTMLFIGALLIINKIHLSAVVYFHYNNTLSF